MEESTIRPTTTAPDTHTHSTDSRNADNADTNPSDLEASNTAKEENGPFPSSSRRHLETAAFSSLLENLPSELRDLILLSIPDIPTLRSLTHASPVMHAQYRSNRHRILSACLARELDGLFVDAYACLMSRARALGPVRTDEKIVAFLNGYYLWLSGSGPGAGDVSLLDPSDVRWLAAYQLSVALPMARWYSAWALANLEQATIAATGSAEDVRSWGNMSPSRSEERRVLQALYRYETFHNLFGQNESMRLGGFRHDEINEIFFCLLDPWEAEAVGCIDLFVRQRYENIFDQVKEDLHPRNPRFELEEKSAGSFDLVDKLSGRPTLRQKPSFWQTYNR